MVNTLGRRCQDLPLLIVGLARPSLLERRPHWGEGQLFHRKIQLEPLSKRESRQLVEEILQKIEQVPVPLRELVVSGAEGNPFYIEELLKMLVEQGVIVKGEERWSVQTDRLAHADVPSTLTGVLQARLDSLPPKERSVLQQASVVGRVFWDQVVEHLHSRGDGEGEEISPLLDGLRDREMVFRREESVFANALEYIFKHEVLREVTYETVLKKLRRMYHGWVADWLIEQGGEEHSGLIADHLERAGRGEQAGVYLQRAGEAALASYANAEAARYFRRALDLDHPKADRPALLGGLAEALQRQGYRDEAHKAWREGIEIYQAQGDLEGVSGFFTAIVRSLLPAWPKEAIQIIEIALPAVEGMEENRALGHLLHQAARAYYFHGEGADRAENLCRQALEIAERLGDLELQADASVTIGVLHLSEAQQELEVLHRAVELAEANRFLYVACRAHHNLGVVYSFTLSDSRSAITHFQRALEIARERGDVEAEVFELEKLLQEQLSLGNIVAAENYLKELERTEQKMPQPELADYRIFESRAYIYWMRGDFNRALELFNQCIAEAQRESRRQTLFEYALYSYLSLLFDIHRYLDWVYWGSIEEILTLASHSRGVIDPGEAEAALSAFYARQGRIEEARLWLERARDQIRPNPIAAAYSLLITAEVELAIAESRWESAISKSTSLFELDYRAGRRWYQAHSLLELAEIHRMRGQPEDRERSIALYNQARELFAAIGATGYVEIVDGRLRSMES